MKNAAGPWSVTFLLIASVVFVTLYLHRPPDVVSAGAAASEFSAPRAFEHLKVLAKGPHPVGTTAHDEARDYILNELTKLGLNPEVQVSERKNRSGETFKLQNIVARLKGTAGSGRSLLLVAHYDTTSQSPGASDDGSGVVTLLEVLRALKSRSPLKHDVQFLFSDGEELGMLGAKAFVLTAFCRDVSLVMNFEARGSRGPVFMFETGDNNVWAIKQFGNVVPYPFASSIYEEIYRTLANETDFTIFRNQGLQGFNFAFIDGLENYHSSNDDLSRLDLRSLQHHGSYALALTTFFGDTDLNQTASGNAVFFDGLGRIFVSYPERFVLPIALILTLLLGGVIVFGMKKGRLSLGWSSLGLLSFVVSAVCCLFVTTLVAGTLVFVVGQTIIRQQAIPLLVGLAALNVAVITCLYLIASRYTTFDNLSAGTLIGWLLCTVAVSFYFPGASYVLQWPLLAGMCAFALNLNFRSSKVDWLVPVVSSCLGAIPGLVLFTWTGDGIFQAIGLKWPVLVPILVLLLVGLLLPVLEFLRKPWLWLVPAGFLLTSLTSYVIALA